MNSPLRSTYKQAEYKRQNLYAWLFLLAQVCVVVIVLFFLLLKPVRVNGISMTPTLTPGEVLLVDKLTFFLRSPSRGDMVIFPHPETGEELIKRVVGLPGETLEIKNGHVYIDGRYLDESAYTSAQAADFPAVQVPALCVFVLGDERGMSLDSRELGAISFKKLDGRVRMRIAPINGINLFL